MQKISKVNPLLRGGWKESHLLHISQYLTMFVGGIWNCRWFFYLLIGMYIVINVYIYYTIIKCVRVCVCVIFSYICTSIKILSTKYMKKIDFNWYVDLDFSVDSCLFYILILLYLGRLLRADDHGSHLRWAVRIVQLWAWISQEKLWLRSSNAIYIIIYICDTCDMIWYGMVWYAYIYIYVCVCARIHTCVLYISMRLSARKSLSYSCFFAKRSSQEDAPPSWMYRTRCFYSAVISWHHRYHSTYCSTCDKWRLNQHHQQLRSPPKETYRTGASRQSLEDREAWLHRTWTAIVSDPVLQAFKEADPDSHVLRKSVEKPAWNLKRAGTQRLGEIQMIAEGYRLWESIVKAFGDMAWLRFPRKSVECQAMSGVMTILQSLRRGMCQRGWQLHLWWSGPVRPWRLEAYMRDHEASQLHPQLVSGCKWLISMV